MGGMLGNDEQDQNSRVRVSGMVYLYSHDHRTRKELALELGLRMMILVFRTVGSSLVAESSLLHYTATYSIVLENKPYTNAPSRIFGDVIDTSLPEHSYTQNLHRRFKASCQTIPLVIIHVIFAVCGNKIFKFC
jgi:hypothetical protein